MVGSLHRKVAIVTGGASGIGRGIVERFIQADAQVMIADVQDERGEALSQELGDRAAFLRTDVAKPACIEVLVRTTVARFGGIQIMVNNAGISGKPHVSFLDDDLEDFDRVVQVNLRGVMLGTRWAGRHMADHGGGSIINIASIGGSFAGHGLLTYRATKAAVLHFTRCAAIDLAAHGIRVNSISPGHIATEMTSFESGSDLPPSVMDELKQAMTEAQSANQPLKRQGTCLDVAEAALFLAGDGAAYVTGVDLEVDGGTSIGDPVNQLERMITTRQSILGTT